MRAILDHFADAGIEYTIVDLAASGRSIYRPPVRFETWLNDIGEIYERTQSGSSLWIATSIGAWPLLLTHRQRPEWFRAMCIIAPAIDWDSTYLLPGVASGKLTDEPAGIRNEHGVLPRSLVDSMALHHLLGRALEIHCPLHCIYGARDEIAPPAATEQLLSQFRGASATSEKLADESHAIAKIATSAAQRALMDWLQRQLHD